MGSIVRLIATLSILLSSIVAALPASTDSVLWKEVRGWLVYSDKTVNNYCYMVTVFDEYTLLRIGFWNGDSRDLAYVAVGNPNWKSIEEGKDYEITYQFDNLPPWRASAAVWMSSGVPFLHTTVNDVGFFDELIRKHSLSIFYQGRTVATLSLSGSAAASRELALCQQAHTRPTAPAPAPKDPFQGTSTSPNAKDPFAL
jgi:hypothetical protein